MHKFPLEHTSSRANQQRVALFHKPKIGASVPSIVLLPSIGDCGSSHDHDCFSKRGQCSSVRFAFAKFVRCSVVFGCSLVIVSRAVQRTRWRTFSTDVPNARYSVLLACMNDRFRSALNFSACCSDSAVQPFFKDHIHGTDLLTQFTLCTLIPRSDRWLTF